MGRPVEYTKERISTIIEAMEEYIDKTDIPIVAEFAYKNNIRRQTLYEIDGFSDTLKKLTEKKEAQLEKMGLYGEVEKTMAIFSLKQLGWRDKPKDDEDDNLQESFKAIADKLLDGNK